MRLCINADKYNLIVYFIVLVINYPKAEPLYSFNAEALV